MNLSGKITLFVEKRSIQVEGKEKVVTDLSTNVSAKQKDGTYINKRIKVKLASKKFPEEAVAKLNADECYTMEVFDGFHSVESWIGKNKKERREVIFAITDGKLTGHKKVEKKVVAVEVKDDDLPF